LKFRSEAWVLKKREEQRLEAAQKKFLRHLLGITKVDKEKNQCVREKTGVQNIVKEIKQYQEKWPQHLQRMDTNRIPKQALLFKVCKSVHHRTIQINHQPDATIFQFIILTFIYSSTCFGRSPAHHQELNDFSSSLWFYLRIVVIAVLCS